MIKREVIEKLAELSRIEVKSKEVEKFSKDIESILEYMSELTEVAVEEPKSEVGTLHNVMRIDGEPHAKGFYTESILEAAPEREGNYFRVKKILE